MLQISVRKGAEQFHCSAHARIELCVILVAGRIDANRRRFLISNDGRLTLKLAEFSSREKFWRQ